MNAAPCSWRVVTWRGPFASAAAPSASSTSIVSSPGTEKTYSQPSAVRHSTSNWAAVRLAGLTARAYQAPLRRLGGPPKPPSASRICGAHGTDRMGPEPPPDVRAPHPDARRPGAPPPPGAAPRAPRRGAAGSPASGLDERDLHDVLGDEPDLHLVAAQDVA